MLTWYWGLGFGELVWRVEVEVGRVRVCILDGNRGEEVEVAVQHAVRQNTVDKPKLGIVARIMTHSYPRG